MIPVYYDACDEVWKKADGSNENSKYVWYDYDSKMWANSVTVTSTNRDSYLDADPGTEIPMDDILTMQVWIPRYKYTVWNYNVAGTTYTQPKEIEIEFEEGIVNSGEISCSDAISGTNGAVSETCKIKGNNATCTDSTCNGKTYAHPAFTFGDKELTGFWVGKFEVSSDTNCSPTDHSAIGASCNLDIIRPLVKPNVTSWRGAMVGTFENNIMTMNDSSNKYGFASSDDTHMIKNMEWGAIAYLSHSKYGTCTNGECEEISLNSYEKFMTGCGPQSVESMASGVTCNSYETNLGRSTTTTGNIYGIYDMSGGAWEYVMGNMVSPNGTTMMSGYRGSNNSYSGYTGIVYYATTSGDYKSYTGSYSYPNVKYYDKYSYSTSTTNKKTSKLGDATREVATSTSEGWYGDYGYVPSSDRQWVYRGGRYSFEATAGLFSAYGNIGASNENGTSRVVISQING